MESMWEHEDQPHWRDYLMAVFFASFFPVARLFLDSIIFEVNCEMLTTFNALKKSARRLLFSGEKKVTKKRLLEVNEKKVSKFTESAWKLTYYMFTTTTLLLSARNEPWFGKTEHFWIEWPNHAIK
uniref:Uncharacterized protein n=1 Tax=Physcomitrium patens TaxID=3218 RepID=A0A2K1JBW9_PHYPA|nr:hypothetical protein PHYPA_019304 [Physcomitrium patens]